MCQPTSILSDDSYTMQGEIFGLALREGVLDTCTLFSNLNPIMLSLNGHHLLTCGTPHSTKPNMSMNTPAKVTSGGYEENEGSWDSGGA